MELTCKFCGQNIEVNMELKEGDVWECPNCGKEIVHTTAQEKTKPVFALRGKTQAADEVSKEMASAAVKAVENRARIVEDQKDREALRKRLGLVFSLLGWMVLLVGLLVGVDIWWTRKEKADIALAEEQLLQAQAEAEKNEAERIHLQELKAMREKEAAEREEARQAKIAREEAERAKLRIDRERFGSYVLTIQNANLAFISDLKKQDSKPTEIAYLLPRVDGGLDAFVVVERQTNGTEQIYALTRSGAREPVDRELFEKRCQEQDYLAIAEQKVYFRSSRKKQHVGRLSKQKVENLSDAFFGMISQDVRTFDPDFSNLSFEIVFVPDPKKPKEFVVADVVEFGSSYSLSRVRDAVVKAYPPKSVKLEDSKSRKFKRHYRFWSGSHIKTGIDGVTYVPLSEPRGKSVSVHWSGSDRVYTMGSSSAESVRWASLKAKVEAEEREEAAFYREQAARQRVAYSSLTKTAQEKYEEELNQIMSKGELFFRAKLK